MALCPAIVFFSALKEVDDASQVVPADLRNQALQLTAKRLRASDADFKPQLAKMMEVLEAWVRAGDFDFVTPVALLKASAACDWDALEAGFRAVGLRLDIILNRIERDPADNLADKLPGPIPRVRAPKYAVIIEGPGFRDTRNRYSSIARAKYVAELLDCTIKGATHKGPSQSVSYSRPPELERATRIYVEKLQNRSETLSLALRRNMLPRLLRLINWGRYLPPEPLVCPNLRPEIRSGGFCAESSSALVLEPAQLVPVAARQPNYTPRRCGNAADIWRRNPQFIQNLGARIRSNRALRPLLRNREGRGARGLRLPNLDFWRVALQGHCLLSHFL